MRTNLTVDELGDLLTLPLVGTLATYRSSGDVLLSPVWYEWRDGGFNVVVGRNDFKAQHIRRDPRASLAVYENAEPLRGLEIRGTAKLFTEGLHEVRFRIWQHYSGKDPDESDEAEIGVRLEGIVRAWDFAD
jgi:PPOX class probable F420-dependent enzyme